MSAITIHVSHVGPINQRKSELIKAATQLLKEIINQEAQTELIVVEDIEEAQKIRKTKK